MPRKARIDAPGPLHHVIIRGFERRKIFRSDYDRENFITRLAELIPISITYIGCSAIVTDKPAKGIGSLLKKVSQKAGDRNLQVADC
jgi:hypothetical protein